MLRWDVFLGAVDEAISRIVEAPEQPPVIRADYDEFFFVSTVRHLLQMFANLVSVVGVIHGRRHPRTWLP